MAGVDAEVFSRAQVFDDELARELEPGGSLAGDALEQEAVAAEDAGAERLLEAHAELNVGRGAEEAVAMDEVLVAPADLDGDDVAGMRVAKATSPGAPTAMYSVMNRVPPPATRLMTPRRPPPPAIWVWVCMAIDCDIQESSPASEMMESLDRGGTRGRAWWCRGCGFACAVTS